MKTKELIENEKNYLLFDADLYQARYDIRQR